MRFSLLYTPWAGILRKVQVFPSFAIPIFLCWSCFVSSSSSQIELCSLQLVLRFAVSFRSSNFLLVRQMTACITRSVSCFSVFIGSSPSRPFHALLLICWRLMHLMLPCLVLISTVVIPQPHVLARGSFFEFEAWRDWFAFEQNSLCLNTPLFPWRVLWLWNHRSGAHLGEALSDLLFVSGFFSALDESC